MTTLFTGIVPHCAERRIPSALVIHTQIDGTPPDIYDVAKLADPVCIRIRMAPMEATARIKINKLLEAADGY